MSALRLSTTNNEFIRPRMGFVSTTSSGKYSQAYSDFPSAYLAVFRMWQVDTAFLSDPNKIKEHQAFPALVRHAETALPIILSELRKRPSFFVWVLNEAFGGKEGTPRGPGNLRQLADEWVRWGAQHDASRRR